MTAYDAALLTMRGAKHPHPIIYGPEMTEADWRARFAEIDRAVKDQAMRRATTRRDGAVKRSRARQAAKARRQAKEVQS